MEQQYLRGIVTVLDEVNANGRMYTTPVMNKAIQKYKENEYMWSQFGVTCADKQYIDLEKVGAKCYKLEIIGNYLWCTLSVLDNHVGKSIIDLINNGTRVMFALRGNIRKSSTTVGGAMLIDDLDIISIDVIPHDGVDLERICILTPYAVTYPEDFDEVNVQVTGIVKYDLFPYYTVVRGELRDDGGIDLSSYSYHKPESVIKVLGIGAYEAEKERLAKVQDEYRKRHQELRGELFREFGVDFVRKY